MASALLPSESVVACLLSMVAELAPLPGCSELEGGSRCAGSGAIAQSRNAGWPRKEERRRSSGAWGEIYHVLMDQLPGTEFGGHNELFLFRALSSAIAVSG